jgi:hypothetical protein
LKEPICHGSLGAKGTAVRLVFSVLPQSLWMRGAYASECSRVDCVKKDAKWNWGQGKRCHWTLATIIFLASKFPNLFDKTIPTPQKKLENKILSFLIETDVHMHSHTLVSTCQLQLLRPNESPTYFTLNLPFIQKIITWRRVTSMFKPLKCGSKMIGAVVFSSRGAEDWTRSFVHAQRVWLTLC